MSDTEFLAEFRKELSNHSEQIAVQSVNIDYIKGSVDEIKDIFKESYTETNKRLNKVEKESVTKGSILKTILLVIAALSAVGTIAALN